jgi:hypothetical protein
LNCRPNLESSDFFEQHLSHDGLTPPKAAKWYETAGILPPDSMSVHHTLMFHGSGSYHSTHPRSSLAIHICMEKNQPHASASGDIVEDKLTDFIDDFELYPILCGEPLNMLSKGPRKSNIRNQRSFTDS